MTPSSRPPRCRQHQVAAGQALVRSGLPACCGLPWQSSAHAVETPSTSTTVRKALARRADLVILGGGDGTSAGPGRPAGRPRRCSACCRSAPPTASRARSAFRSTRGRGRRDRTGGAKRIDLGMIDDDYFANCAAMGSRRRSPNGAARPEEALGAARLSRLGDKRGKPHRPPPSAGAY